MLLDRLKRHWIRVALGLSVMVLFLLHVGGFVRMGFVDRLEYFAYDARLLFHLQEQPDNRIVIIDIDERSLKEEGRWPWGRDKVARLIKAVFDDYDAGLLGFDVVFAEPDDSSGLGVLEGLAENELADNSAYRSVLETLRPSLNRDKVLAETMVKYPVVLGYYFANTTKDKILKTGKLPQPVFTKKHFSGRSIPFMKANGYGANLEALQDAALGAGHFVPYVDLDGVVRRVPMLYEFEGAFYESLSLSMARLALREESVSAGFPEESKAGGTYQGVEWLQVGERRIPVDERVRALVPYRGPQGSFPYVSATDVLSGKADKKVFEKRIVLVGTSAPGLQDLRSTPVQSIYPGVEIHANLIAGILDNRIMEDPAYTLGAEFLVTLLFGITMAMAIPLLSPLASTICTLVLMLGVVVVNVAIWRYMGIVFSLSSGLLMIAMFWFGFKTYMNSVVPPSDAYEIKVTGQKWFWTFEYPDSGIVFSTAETESRAAEGIDTALVVPVNQPVKLSETARTCCTRCTCPPSESRRT